MQMERGRCGDKGNVAVSFILTALITEDQKKAEERQRTILKRSHLQVEERARKVSYDKATVKRRPVECNLLIVSWIMIESRQPYERTKSWLVAEGAEGWRKVISRLTTRRANLQSHFKFLRAPSTFFKHEAIRSSPLIVYWR